MSLYSRSTSECYEPELHSLRCRSCSCSLTSLPSTSCCRRSVSMCSSCFSDKKCPDCIKEDPSTGYINDETSTALVKITAIENYNPGDIVMFYPVLERVGTLLPQLNLLHINKPKPFVLLHDDCYEDFNFQKGKFCDHVIAKLTSTVITAEPEESRGLCQLFGETDTSASDGSEALFYTVKAEPVHVTFPSSRQIKFYSNSV